MRLLATTRRGASTIKPECLVISSNRPVGTHSAARASEEDLAGSPVLKAFRINSDRDKAASNPSTIYLRSSKNSLAGAKAALAVACRANTAETSASHVRLTLWTR